MISSNMAFLSGKKHVFPPPPFFPSEASNWKPSCPHVGYNFVTFHNDLTFLQTCKYCYPLYFLQLSSNYLPFHSNIFWCFTSKIFSIAHCSCTLTKCSVNLTNTTKIHKILNKIAKCNSINITLYYYDRPIIWFWSILWHIWQLLCLKMCKFRNSIMLGTFFNAHLCKIK